jgi:hypothetical protein
VGWIRTKNAVEIKHDARTAGMVGITQESKVASVCKVPFQKMRFRAQSTVNIQAVD